MTPIHALAILTLLPLAGTVPRVNRSIDMHMPAAFTHRIVEYVELHRRTAAGFGDSILCADPEEVSRQAAVLAAAIRQARPLANEGDIFSPEVAAAFRARIAYAVRTAPIEPTPAWADEDELQLDVHDVLPWGVGNQWWPAIVRALPDLPAELEYRFIGRHLVLLDVPANLIVDVLRDALPARRHTPAVRPADSCDVHPNLPACWM
jgi:hypothetical protein